MAVGVGGLDGGGELYVGEGLRVALLPLVGGVRVFAQGRDIGLGKPDLLKRHGQAHLLVKGGVALKVLGIARIDMCMISFRIYTLYRKGHRKDLRFRLIVLQMQWKNTANLYIQRIMMR